MGNPEDDLAERFFNLFRGFNGAHGTFSTPVEEAKPSGMKYAIKSSARTLRTPVTVDLWDKHLKGEYPLGIMPLCEDGTVFWAAIDVDLYDLDHSAIVKRVEDAKIKLIPVKSKSGGLHLFIFFKEAQSARLVQEVLRHIAAKLGFGTSEIFPKQTTILAERGDLPSWIAAPYGTTFGGLLSEQAAIRRTGAELTPEEFLNLAEASRISGEELRAIGEAPPARRPSNAPPAPSGGGGIGVDRNVPLPASAADSPFLDGPPCIQHLAAIKVTPGGQNNFLLQMGIYLKKKDPENWKTLLERANLEYLTPPGSMDGLLSVIRSLEKTDYNYRCKDVPCVNYCNSSVCRTRKFGVGVEGDYPVLGGISILTGEPPLWFVDVNDTRLELTTEELQNYMRFHAKCMERLHKSFRIMKQDAWLMALGETMQAVVILEAPDDGKVKGHFMEILNEFLTNRQKGEKRDDLFSGKPVEEEGRHYFRLRDLQLAIEREGMRNMTRARIIQRVRDIGGDSEFFNVNGKGINVWWVPSSALPGSPEISLPALDRSPI